MITHADKGKNTVQSLAKGFRVLEAFSAHTPEMTLSEIARCTELDPGTVFRIANTLVALGYLQKVPDSKRFRLSLKVLDLGFNALGRMELRSVARPILRSLVGQVNEAASLAALDGTDVVYLERVHAGLVRLGVDTRVGSRLPSYYTMLGHAILAYLPREQVLKVLEAQERIRLTPSTPVTIGEIDSRLERVRELGYALSDQEVISGLRILAAPVFDIDGQVCAAVSVAAPSMRMPLDEFMRRTVAPLKQAAADIGKAMQSSGAATVAALSA